MESFVKPLSLILEQPFSGEGIIFKNFSDFRKYFFINFIEQNTNSEYRDTINGLYKNGAILWLILSINT